jgi:hypothetical protein
MPAPILPRVFSARGRTYRVSIAPMERSGGLGAELLEQALIRN